MKRLFILVLSVSVIFAGCRTTMPIHEDDISVHVNLQPSFTHGSLCRKGCTDHHHSHYYYDNDPVVTVGFYHSGFANDDDNGFLIFLLLVFTAGWYFGSTRMYAAPEGYETEYTQQLYWGDNRFFLPKAAQDGTVLILETFGSMRRKWRYPFKPQPNKALILKNSSILEKEFKPIVRDQQKLREVESGENELKELGINN